MSDYVNDNVNVFYFARRRLALTIAKTHAA